MFFHERTEVIRMTRGQRATLPVQALVHVENKETSQRNFARIYQLRERRIPALRSARDDGACWPTLLVVSCDFIHQFPCHQQSHLGGITHRAEAHSQISMGWKV